MKHAWKRILLGGGLGLCFAALNVCAQVKPRLSMDGQGNVISTDAQGNQHIVLYNSGDGRLDLRDKGDGNVYLVDSSGTWWPVPGSASMAPLNWSGGPGLPNNALLYSALPVPAQSAAAPATTASFFGRAANTPDLPYTNVTTDGYGNIFATDSNGNTVQLYANRNSLTDAAGFDSAYVDAEGSVFGRDSSGETHLIYDNPRRVGGSSDSGPYTKAVVDQYGNVYGIDDQGSRTTVYSNPNSQIPGTGFRSATVDGSGNVIGTDAHGVQRKLSESGGAASSLPTGNVWK